MAKTAKLHLRVPSLKVWVNKFEKRVKEVVPSSTMKKVESIRKQVSKRLTKLEKEAQGRFKQTMKLLRIPTRNEIQSARRARVNAAAKTFGLVTDVEFQKLQKKVKKLNKQFIDLSEPKVSSRATH
jgi:formiminotetrahydrofolate cyclodeaminase